ncbi:MULTISPECIES: spermidine synthase [unclassified Curtobacterium]|uniref:spermidine synthase n=1 Tax=unclassified Curtobacterium TaxID=257496 RepID=UPI000DA7B4D7|nr:MULTISPECIES: fused MFS/spermidine synthase [unclassified Curtobacterium]PZE23685.1 spermine synthase [Curtobacterium sp. MCBD17_028]PZF60057.1 spermine synthase [Curtobacterium sp. MCBD17_013]PZF62220.1 spermine synthase [Curtobacterium sp. MCBD17_034]PZM33033.1 spermine synthase [Curtobacterium sp. MCBD17_031]WIE54883.1 fused MFS/spermidine synthase [Curtobacterium sp. MCBD17_003]
MEDAIRIGAGIAVIEPDRHRPGSYTLVVDGTPQSHVDLEDPTHLAFEYVRRIGHAIDLLPSGPITALHLGAGALTLPRYVAATRPGSRQQVIELERDLVDLVRKELPLPRDASIRVRYGDARAVLERLPAGLAGTVDLAVVDVFSGSTTPAHVTSIEFHRELAALLSPTGIIAVNAADGAGLAFVRGQLATLQAVLPSVAAVADTGMLKGRRFGNVVLLASPTELPFADMPRRFASDPLPSKVVHGAELTALIAGAAVVTDDTATGSPEPNRSVFTSGR